MYFFHSDEIAILRYKQVAKKFPNRVVNLRMRSTKAPHLSIMNGTIGGAFEGTIAFRIAQKNAPDIVLFVSNTVSVSL